MNKPSNYDNVEIQEWQAVKPGGHKGVILKVEETQSKTENHYAMLVISFDFDKSDQQAGYYKSQYLRDEQAGRDAKWRGMSYLVVDSRTEYGDANLKRFLTAVEDSNPGFTVKWGKEFCDCLKNQKVGVVMREEEYTKYDGSFGVSVKPLRFCNYETAESQSIPKIKLQAATQQSIQDQYNQFQQNQPPAQMTWDTQTQEAHKEGFMQIPEDSLDDEGLPFK